MTTANAISSVPLNDSMAPAQSYQQAMQSLNAIVAANPADNGVVLLKPGQMTKVATQAGQHYKLRKANSDGRTLEIADNVVAVRHGDDLHLRYADGSTASFDNFFNVCTDASVCSVTVAGDNGAGITLSGASASNGPATDDGLLVYAHGDPNVLMAMAQDQPGLESAVRGLGDAAVVTYLPPDSHLGALALLALGAVGAAGAASTGGGSAVSALGGEAVIAAQSSPIDTISAAAQNNTAASSQLAASVYAAAGVSGVTAANLASVNSALDSLAVTGAQADTKGEVQAIVDAYNAILASADGVAANTGTALTGAQYSAIGVTGVSGLAAAGNALFLLNNVVDGKPLVAVDTEAEVQALANAANHVIDAAGGTPAQIAALTAADLAALGVTGVTADYLPAVLATIGATRPDSAVDTLPELQTLVNGALSSAANALAIIRDAAQNNNATDTTPDISVYVAAGVSGITAANLSAINNALDSLPVKGADADSRVEVQAIVDAYNAILQSADGVGGNTPNGPTSQQYTLVGVTGVFGTPAADAGIHLLNDVVDALPKSGVDTIPELQLLADAANHVSAAAGGTPAQIASLTQADLVALGITGVTTDNFTAVQAAIGATAPDTAIDTRVEVQQIVTAAAAAATNALATIRDAAQNNTATTTTPAIGVYVAAGVTGVTAADLASINSALDTVAVTGAQADTTAEVQAIVNAYNAILSSADGVANNTSTPLTGTQYTLVGVTGLSGVSAPGNVLHLLDDVVDASPFTAVDTAPELQTLADGAAHVISGAAGGTLPTLLDLSALGISGVTATNLAAVQAAIAATPDDGTGIDTRGELQTVVNSAITTGQVPHISSALGGVTNLEVTSNLVLSADQSVIVGTGLIRITDLGGPGYQGDTTTNTQTIDVATAVANHLLTITGSGANTHIVINPVWDLDLSSNYQLSFDSGVFLDAGGSHVAVAVAPINFSTVTPGTHTTNGTAPAEAVASQTMVDATGALTAGKSWLNIQGIGNNTGGVTQLGDLSSGAYALVMKNYATAPGGAAGNGTDGIATHDTNVGVTNFGNNDIVYFDSQVNNSTVQFFDGRYTEVTDGGRKGGLAGQNCLVMGETSTPQQSGSTAMILLGLEGNTGNLIYPGIETLGTNIGWANVWHNTNPPVIMG